MYTAGWWFLKGDFKGIIVDIDKQKFSFFFITWRQSYNISHNAIEEWPIQVERLENLKDLDVSYNLIPSVPESIGKIRSLEYLDASHNKIVSLPNSLFYLSNLTTLLLSNNLIENFGLDSTNVLKKLTFTRIKFLRWHPQQDYINRNAYAKLHQIRLHQC